MSKYTLSFFLLFQCSFYSYAQVLNVNDFSYTVTDANMTVQVDVDVMDPLLDNGDLLGAFFTNGNGDLQNAGLSTFEGNQLAIAVWASEAGVDNGFAAGEEIQWIMYDLSDNSVVFLNAQMNTSAPFSSSYIINGFGQILSLSVQEDTGSSGCTDNDDALGGLTCQQAVSFFGCDGIWLDYLISDVCPESCGLYCLGCLDSTALNYNPNASGSDGSCVYPSFGCTNEAAWNYDPSAIDDDGSCYYAPWTVPSFITDCNATLGIDVSSSVWIDATNDDGPITDGDFIGAFYTDLNGELVCAGLSAWSANESLSMTIWGDDSTTEDVKEGFYPGENIIWQIWNNETNEIIDNIEVEFSVGSSVFECNSIILTNSIYATAIITQDILLPEGWSMFSTYLSLNLDISELSFLETAGLDPVDPVIVKNSAGDVYWPFLGINNIGSLTDGEGYYIKMNTSSSVTLQSYSLAENNINLDSGWSIIAYLNNEPGDITAMLESIESNIVLVKDYQGYVYWPLINVNTIGNLIPGSAYLINVDEPISLSYPDVNGRFTFVNDNEESIKYSEPKNTGNNMIVGIPSDIWITSPSVGDEIVVYDSEGLVVGHSFYRHEGTVLTVWGDDETTMEKDGLFLGEEFFIKISRVDNSIEEEIDILSWKEGSGYYSINGISIAGSMTQNIVREKELIKITDVLGREVKKDIKGSLLYIYDDGSMEKKYILK